MRETNPLNAKSRINITFSNKEALLIYFKDSSRPIPKNENSNNFNDIYFYYSNSSMTMEMPPIQLSKKNINHSLDKLEDFIKEFMNIKINYLNQETNYNINTQEMINILNYISNNLIGIVNSSNKQKLEELADLGYILPALNYINSPFTCDDISDTGINVALNDDFWEKNYIKINMLPSGWKAIVRIISFVKNAEVNSVCLIEEPETHLHPKLQRILLNEISKYIKERNLQIFIATHSPTFINSKLNGNINVSIFEADGNIIRELNNQTKLMELLGIKASDILQTNGIIWIEGPSDRIYIKKWLELWCKKYNKSCPVENIDYSFSLYGGSILSHFTIDEEKDLISMIKMNRNVIIVIDNDNEFIFNDKDEYKNKKNKGKTKQRIINEFNALNNDNLYIWLTRSYTIESYLEKTFITKYFTIDFNRKLILRKGKNKVIAANNTINKLTEFKNKYDLEKHIENIFYIINNWNN